MDVSGRNVLLGNNQDEIFQNSVMGFTIDSGTSHELESQLQLHDTNIFSNFPLNAHPDEDMADLKIENIFGYSVSENDCDYTSNSVNVVGSTEEFNSVGENGQPPHCFSNNNPACLSSVSIKNTTSLDPVTNLLQYNSQPAVSSQFNPLSCHTSLPNVTCVTAQASAGFTCTSSPGSDSGYASEHCVSDYSIQQQRLTCRELNNAPKGKAMSLGKPDRSAIKLVIPQNVLDTMQHSMGSVDATKTLCQESNVKYLVPVNIEKCGTESTKYCKQVSEQKLFCGKKADGSFEGIPRPLLVIPETDLIQISGTKEESQAARHIIKLINTSDMTTVSQNATSFGELAKRPEKILTQGCSSGGYVSLERKTENAAMNRFVCAGCGKVFALNRIILRTGGLCLQGKPQYCINCFENYQLQYQPVAL